MDLRYKFDLEVRINALAARRRTLDRQLQVRSVTMSELEHVKAESMKRLCNAVADQNEQARARNSAIREQFYSQTPMEKSSAKVSAKKSADKLHQAKEEYLKHVETMLPIWHRHQAVQLEERVRAIQLEKALSLKRREQLQTELMRENTTRQQLERHRQDLLYSLAEEQRIVLESQANAILLEEESKAINAQVMNQMSRSTHEIQGLVAGNIHRMHQDIQQAYFPPPNVPSYLHRMHHHPGDQRDHQGGPGYHSGGVDPRESNYLDNLPLPIHHTGHGTLVLPTESSIDQTAEYPPETERSARSANMSVMTPTVASAYNPRSRSSSLSAGNAIQYPAPLPHLPHGVLAQPTTQSTQPAQAATELNLLTERSADQSGLSTHKNAKRVSEAISGADGIHNTAQAGRHAAPSPSAHQRLFGDVELNIQTNPGNLLSQSASPKAVNAAPLHRNQNQNPINHSLSYSGSKPNSPKLNTSNISLLSNLGNDAPAGVAQDTLTPHVDSTDEVEVDTSVQQSRAIDALNAHSPKNKAAAITSPRSSFAVPIEVRAAVSPSSQAPHTSFFGDENVNTSLSRLNSTMSDASFKSTSGGDSIAALVSQLNIAQCTALLQVIAAAIEKRATEGSMPVSASTIYDTQSRHRAVHIIDAFLSGDGVEDVKLSAVLNNAADSTLGNAVLAIVEGKSSVLIPSDAFTGVMTMDKLKKEYKRVGPPGIQALWDKLVVHLQALVAFKYNSLNFLSLCFTSALTAHVDEDDKSRLARKVSNLLQLALIPPETKELSSPSPPYRGRPQSAELDSPPARATHSAGVNVNNPNISGISASSLSPDSSNPLQVNISKVTSKPAYNFNLSGTTGNNSVGESNAKKATASAALYGKASAALKISRHASEFDDDEIVDDETIEKPPPLKDLDMGNGAGTGTGTTTGTSDQHTVHSQYSQLTHSTNSSDNTSFEARPVRAVGAAASTPSRKMQNTSSYGGNNSSNYGGGGADDEFDF